ncbi:MAG: peptide deformylase [Rhodospirillaceae bacterium]|jgi:peptide deformylase|nr:peptide deformylase [Rhodospirillaceae bacterium]MBT5940343.1 peptide deformylase [Rhodospirillaceae bacterium]MBT7268334.1 peptide deformylase [Rhodospirillaceae bacterium]
MAILKIARMGHPVLHQVAENVDDPTDVEIAVLVEDMLETLDDAGGIGLAAPQVHVSKRVIIFFVPQGRESEDEEDMPTDLTIMVNPIIEPLSDETNLDWEACLSVPGLMGAVERFSHIKYSWTSLEGKLEEREAKGFHARAVQHECDHLDGKLYPMRMTDFTTFGFVEETNRNIALMRKGHGREIDDHVMEEAQ